MTTNILLAGFGGQGILFAGKFLAYSGLIEGKQISWLPSYGPEMRGGTCGGYFSYRMAQLCRYGLSGCRRKGRRDCSEAL